MNPTHIIWDFNGTLLDDISVGIRCTNSMLAARSLPTIDSISDYHRLFCMPVIEYYRRLGFDFDRESYEALAVEWVELYKKQVRHASLHEGAEKLLTELKNAGFRQILISVTENEMLREQTDALGISGFFEEIIGTDDILAYGKNGQYIEWRRRNPDAAVLTVGDTDHDSEAAEIIGAECVLMSCGSQSAAALSCCRANALVGNFSELTEYLKSRGLLPRGQN